uniref:Transposase n=1 Tax=Ochrobactrum sp. LM19 TaxID=1449781 RepID=A0A0D5A162_9HYPH|nr:transposase [Ochrobactrum sp. LM19]
MGRKVSKSQILMDIYETARTSIGLPLPLDAPAIRMFRMVVAEASSLIRQRNETFSHASGSRLVRRCDLTSVMQREDADEQRNFVCQAYFLLHLGRCPSAIRLALEVC